MEMEPLRNHLLGKRGAGEDQPFGPEALVYKVGGKMFALLAPDESPLSVTLKCDPQEALALRDQYPAVQPGYHMNKAHWNTVKLDGSIPDDEILGMADASYDLVVASLTRKARAALEG